VFCAIQKTLDDLEVHMYNRKDNDSIYEKFKLIILIMCKMCKIHKFIFFYWLHHLMTDKI